MVALDHDQWAVGPLVPRLPPMVAKKLGPKSPITNNQAANIGTTSKYGVWCGDLC